jgi:hypothetical protein
MLYNSKPASTLYVKANFKRKPYSNEIVTFRIVAHVYENFTSNKALMLVDTNPNTVTLDEVGSIAEELRVRANAAQVVVLMPLPVHKKLAGRIQNLVDQ